MADIERIRRAFAEWPYYQENPGDVIMEIEDWVEAIVEGIKRGYDEVVIVDGEHADALRERGIIEFPTGAGEEDTTTEIPEDLSRLSDSALREYALRYLEGATELLADTGSELLWIRYSETSGRGEAFIAFDELE